MRFSIFFSPFTTNTSASPFGVKVTAVCGNSTALPITAWARLALTYIPGIKTPFGFSNTARNVTVPVLFSTLASESANLPIKGYISPSSKTICT